MTANRLATETSPYLLQHAANPVHWRPWDPEALTEARDTDRPILLSIGYAACHWCHVMAHESFENDAIAAVMNQNFVNIKVDREERPDLDTIYQHALQLMGQQGGWPLTMFLTPAGEPFWGGTYFPPERRYGRPGFPEILTAISEFYATDKASVADHVGKIRSALSRIWDAPRGGDVPLALIDDAVRRLTGEFDPVNGGIGGAPKFPNPSVLELVWRRGVATGNPEARNAITHTLDRMCQGGIYDHLGGGFARYSTDARWLAPHFEKMLYDNAQLIRLLTAAWRQTASPLYARRVRETADWVLREMIAEGGGFAATLDADSDGEEGRFYVWSAAEIATCLGTGAAAFSTVYDVTPGGNWEGTNILHRNHENGEFSPESEDSLARHRETLLTARNSRTRPGWDDKVLADWNGLMIDALADAARCFDEERWLTAAETAYRFVTTRMEPDGRLRHSARDGKAQHTATLDDYAFMARAAVTLFQITGAPAYLDDARRWMDVLDAKYRDPADGAYYFTANDAEALIARTKSASDNATPSGNAVAADAMAKLYHLTGEDRFRAGATAVITAFSGALTRNFFPLAALLSAAETLQDVTQIAVVGAHDDSRTIELKRAAYRNAPPNFIFMHTAGDSVLPPHHPAAGKMGMSDTPAAFVCRGTTCSLPLTDTAALEDALRTP